MLASYPEQNLSKFFIEGITQGFWVDFNYQFTALKPARKNMESANLHPTVETEYLKTELKHNRVAGPFIPGAVTRGHTSRFGVILNTFYPCILQTTVYCKWSRINSYSLIHVYLSVCTLPQNYLTY